MRSAPGRSRSKTPWPGSGGTGDPVQGGQARRAIERVTQRPSVLTTSVPSAPGSTELPKQVVKANGPDLSKDPREGAGSSTGRSLAVAHEIGDTLPASLPKFETASAIVKGSGRLAAQDVG
jgi:hypothetical protein